MIIHDIINDTLKRKMPDDTLKWCRTSLTMFMALVVSFSMAIIDFIQNGLRFDVWSILVGAALGVRAVDAISKKIRKETVNAE